MKQMIIAVSLLLAFGVGCDEGQGRQLARDRQLPDGTKLFGERTLKDGTNKVERIEFPNGEKAFEVARHRARVAIFALAIEQGTNLSEMGRALGISRQLSSRLGAEAAGLKPT